MRVQDAQQKIDLRFMGMALTLAEKARGRTSPNPLVGAVMVQGGRVIGRGYHRKAGEPHAEVNAIQDAKKRTETVTGSTLYVSLEPCCHFGKTPPCADLIINEKIARVVVAMRDPNPLVSGKGIAALEAAGIRVECGVLRAEAERLNEIFIKYITTGLPFVTLKSAMTADGRIATRTGQSKWITGEASREFVHRLRGFHDGICVGVNTVIADDPELTIRLPGKRPRTPLRIVLDSSGRIPSKSRVLKSKNHGKTILVATEKIGAEKRKELERRGVEVLIISEENGRIDLLKFLSAFGSMGVTSLFVEGGSTVTGAFLDQGLADRLCLFVAPKILGGREGIPFAGGRERDSLDQCIRLVYRGCQVFGEDVMLDYGFVPGEGG